MNKEWISNNTLKMYELEEMSNRRKDQTGLPVNIWIDEAQAYIKGGHSKRIKFQLNKADKISNQPFASMDLDGVVHKGPHFKELNTLSEKDIQQVRNFVLNNSYALSKVADEDIYMEDFDKVMIKGGDLVDNKERNYQIETVNNIITIRINSYANKSELSKYLD